MATANCTNQATANCTNQAGRWSLSSIGGATFTKEPCSNCSIRVSLILSGSLTMQVDRMKSEAGYSLSDDFMAKLYASLDAMAQDLIGAEVSYSPDKHEACRNRLAVDAFENQGMARMIDQYPEFGFDLEAEKAKFVAEALAIPVEGYRSAAIGEYLELF